MSRTPESHPNSRLARLTLELQRASAELAAAGHPPGLAATQHSLRVEEVLASTALAGFALEPVAGKALLARGVAVGGHRLEVYEAVADYSEALHLVEGADPRPLRPHILLRAEELPELHHRAMRRTGHSPGAWRERNAAPVKSGLVPPPHWLVPREVAAFVDHCATGPEPGASPLMWVAAAHARIMRIQPFDGGNGRVARLLSNLLLRRLGLPLATFGGRRATRYGAAIRNADSGDLTALAFLTAEALRDSLSRLLGAASLDELRPLRALAPLERVGALVKAAQRGRLRVVRRGARFYTTAAWLRDYERASAARMDAAST